MTTMIPSTLAVLHGMTRRCLGGHFMTTKTVMISGRMNTIFPWAFVMTNMSAGNNMIILPKTHRELLMLKAIVLDDEQIEKYGILMTPVEDASSLAYTEEAYYQDCEARKETACTSFSRDNSGFTAVSEGEKERLVFFSVPYEDGWSATVNGEPVEIDKVNVGFMAVKVPAGISEIRFTYRTPGLPAGIIVSAVCLILLGGYLFLMHRIEGKKKNTPHRSKLHAASVRELEEMLGCQIVSPQPRHYSPRNQALKKQDSPSSDGS